MGESSGRMIEAAKDWLKHGPDFGFRLVYPILSRTKAREKAEALRLYRAGLAYLAGERPGENAEICRITGGAYAYTFFNICFAGDMISAALDILSKGKKPRIEVCHPTTGENLWEQFFLQPFEGGFGGGREPWEEISCSKRVAFHPNFLSVRDAEEREIWSGLYRDFLRLNPETENYVEAEYRELFPKGIPVLGVLCRGTDYTGTKPKNHPIQPETEEVIEKVKETLDTDWEKENEFRIYLACDERRVEEKFREAFPGKILVNKRVYYDEFYRPGEEVKVIGDIHLNRERDDYRRGLEYLSSLILLSRCRSLIAGNCGGSNAAIYWNGGKYEMWYLFDKGFY